MHFLRPYSKRRLFTYILLTLMILCVSYHEILSYYLNTIHWHALRCGNENKCVRILLVADPQIIGNNEEILHFLTPLSIYDSDRLHQNIREWAPMTQQQPLVTQAMNVQSPSFNHNIVFQSSSKHSEMGTDDATTAFSYRGNECPITFVQCTYLRKTYSRAFNFVQPDIVVFLGDLMDEAHKASNEEFNDYVKRVFNIFLNKGNPSSVRHIWLPGDNDIGGEDSLVTKNKVKRFDRAFSQPSLINFKNITFFKINRLISDIPVFKDKREFYSTDEIFIGLSHVPLMFKPSTFVDKVIDRMKPHLLFTAHEHKSMIISTDPLLRQDFHIIPITPDDKQIFEYTLGTTDMFEILIPTSSYRMGTDKVGYGYAIIENNTLRFTVLWSPSRFTQLRCYFFLILIIFAFSIVYKCFDCVRHSRKIRTKSEYVKLRIQNTRIC